MPGQLFRSRSVAWTPLSTGIFRSISTTSGCRCASEVERLLPIARHADDLDLVVRAQDRFEAIPHDGLIVTDQDTDHPSVLSSATVKMTHVPIPALLLISSVPPMSAGALLHAANAQAAFRCLRHGVCIDALAVIFDLQGQPAVPLVQLDRNRRRTRMPHDVFQGLLRDAVDPLLDVFRDAALQGIGDAEFQACTRTIRRGLGHLLERERQAKVVKRRRAQCVERCDAPRPTRCGPSPRLFRA